MIESIELTNFRNFESRKLVFCNRNIFFLGPNGSGKSNLLESIAFTSLLRSFRGAPPREMIRIGAREFHLRTALRGKISSEILEITETLSGKRKLLINGRPVRRSSDFIREFHTIAFAPEDLEIVSGPSGGRRRFFDILISEIEPEYLMRLSRYHRALLQRNRALKFSPRTAALFEPELAENAPFIADRRRHFAGIVEKEAAALLDGRGTMRITYRTDTADSADGQMKLLESRRESESRRQCTLVGPQLDEFELLFNDKPLRSYGSTGQRRLAALTLKLAQFRTVRSNSGVPVVILADDVTGELDDENLNLFLTNISGAEQVFFTFAEAPRFTLPDSGIIPVGE